MAQSILSVVIEVRPQSAALLRGYVQDLNRTEQAIRAIGDQPYDRLRSSVPALHFMSITVIDDDQYDPVFVLEVNFGGEPGPFWAQLEALIGQDLRDMLRCCKAPQGRTGTLFKSVTDSGSRAPVAPLLEALTVLPLVQHQGNRGLDRARIRDEGKLFASVQGELDAAAQLEDLAPSRIHQTLRTALLPDYPWLGKAARPRIPLAENAADWIRGVAFAAMILIALAVFGLVLSLLVGHFWPQALGTVKVWINGLIGEHSVIRFFVVALIVLAVGTVTTIPGILLWLRWLERRDPATDAPRVDAEAMRRMARLEDHITQNHMISIVHVKPGLLRAVLIRVGLRALGLVLRIAAHDGYLSSMRTIHFAHWALIGNGGRLMFHSNFDGSWESYLDDFIEKAHAGLTLAWTSGVGFPPTRFMVLDGATDGRKFKAWARHSMAESPFWFCAYKQFSVNQIERHARIADGLRRPTMTDKEAAAWALDL
jgi:hypothetical protein